MRQILIREPVLDAHHVPLRVLYIAHGHVSKNLKGGQDDETIDTQWRNKSERQTRFPTRRIRYNSHRRHSLAHQHNWNRTTLQTQPSGATAVVFCSHLFLSDTRPDNVREPVHGRHHRTVQLVRAAQTRDDATYDCG